MSIQTVTGLEAHPNFPIEDISPNTATMVGVRLANSSELQMNHGVAELISPAYKIGHGALLKAAERLELQGSQIAAFNHGIIAFEAAGVLVQHASIASTTILQCNRYRLEEGMEYDELLDYIGKARESFDTEMPLTGRSLSEAAESLFGIALSYVIDGAALARRLELDSAA